MTSQNIEVALADKDSQQIEIIATGSKGFRDVVPGRTEMDFNDEDESPRLDPVAVFSLASKAGFLGDERFTPWLASCDVIDATADPEKQTLRWNIAVNHMSLAGLRVLLNTLVARNFESLRLAATKVNSTDIALAALSKLHYPSPFAPCPFNVVRKEPMKTSKDRSLRVFLSAPPSDKLVEDVYKDLSLWTWLLNVGAYPHPGDDPAKSGAIPDLATLIDESTFEQAFPEAFFCDEAAFDAAINWAMCLHRRQPVEKVEIE